jgi:hypothetical protein
MVMEHTLSCGKHHSQFAGAYSPSRERVPWRNRDEYARAIRNRLRGKNHIIKKHAIAPKPAAKYVFARKTRHYLKLALGELRVTPVVIDFEQRFYLEAEKWDEETAHLSSPAQKFAHPSYVAILGMANDNRDKVIDLLLQDMQRNRREWFWALSYLTHENPIPRSASGRLDKMIMAWVEWGKERGRI